MGKQPKARYMHQMEFYKEGNFVMVIGGRNDSDVENSVLDDIWLLYLNNLEWQKVTVTSGSGALVLTTMIPRCNFCSVLLGSKVIIAGGIGKGFRLLKDFQEIELDQS